MNSEDTAQNAETMSEHTNATLDLTQHAIQALNEMHNHIMDAQRIPEVMIAIIITAIIGVVSGARLGFVYPFLWLCADKTIGNIGARLDKTHRPVPDLLFRGFIVTAFTVGLFVLLARILESILPTLPYAQIITIIVLSLTLSGGAVWSALLKLHKALSAQKISQGAYLPISRSSRVNLTSTDDFGITRTGMAMVAYGFDKGVVAPAIWYLIAGFPALFLYSALSFLSWRFGKNGFSKGFGAIPTALEKLMGYIPSIISSFLLTSASLFTPTAKLHKGLLAWVQNKSKAPYEQGGRPLKSIAWALNVSLGGAVQDLDGSSLQNAWIGPEKATAKTGADHLKRAIYISVMAHMLFVAVLGGAYVWSGLLEKLPF